MPLATEIATTRCSLGSRDCCWCLRTTKHRPPHHSASQNGRNELPRMHGTESDSAPVLHLQLGSADNLRQAQHPLLKLHSYLISSARGSCPSAKLGCPCNCCCWCCPHPTSIPLPSTLSAGNAAPAAAARCFRCSSECSTPYRLPLDMYSLTMQSSGVMQYPMNKMRLGCRSRASRRTSLTKRSMVLASSVSRRLIATTVPCRRSTPQHAHKVRTPAGQTDGIKWQAMITVMHTVQLTPCQSTSSVVIPARCWCRTLSGHPPHTCPRTPLQSRPLPSACPPAPYEGQAPTHTCTAHSQRQTPVRKRLVLAVCLQQLGTPLICAAHAIRTQKEVKYRARSCQLRKQVPNTLDIPYLGWKPSAGCLRAMGDRPCK